MIISHFNKYDFINYEVIIMAMIIRNGISYSYTDASDISFSPGGGVIIR